MAEKTAISWADGTFNPWFGCTKVSVGEKGACTFCYAEQVVTKRLQHDAWGSDKARVRAAPSGWRKPLAWDKDPAKHLWKGEGAPPADWRPFVFCASLADVFDNEVDPQWRADLFDLIHATPNLTWLLLTKRPGNIVKLFEAALSEADKFMRVDPPLMSLAECWPRNAAIGCTVVTQAEADRDIPKLLAAKAALNPAFAFVSMEPLLGPVDLRDFLIPVGLGGRLSTEGKFGTPAYSVPASVREPLDWVITGGETDQGGSTARPSDPNWFRSLRDQCAGAGASFHFKQHGEFQNGVRVGKKAPGWNLLDGVLHDARPHVAP